MTCLAVGSLSGCASAPVEIPEWDLEPAVVEVTEPLRLPELPSPVSSTDSTATFDAEGMEALLQYATVAGGNYEIAVENARALEAQAAAYNELIQAGQLQRQFTQIREEQLANERRDHMINNWVHRGIILLALIGAAL